mgnify:CR=1 FL=1
MTYRDALTLLYSYTNYERLGMPKYTLAHYDLDRIRTLLNKLGNPHHRFKSLLIAGTKGKGSTSAFAESMIRAAGYRTGLYTSPHLHTFRERIRIGGQLISEDEVSRLVEAIQPHTVEIEGLTAFEVITALAFCAFAEAQVEVAVLEIEEVCTGRRAELVVVGEDEYRWLEGHATLKGQTFELQGERIWIPLLGRHQIANAVAAWAAVDGMQRRVSLTVPIPERKQGLQATEWPGRMEILGHRPTVIVDSAHNGDSAAKLRAALGEFFPRRRVTIIFGASGDHPFTDAFSELLPDSARVLVTRSRHPRAAAPETLQQVAARQGYQAIWTASVPEAIEAALEQATSDDVICITGSIFTVADAREYWCQRHGWPMPPVDPIT